MANQLVKYEIGAGLNVVAGANSGKVVIGPVYPASSSTDMYGVTCDASENVIFTDTGTCAVYKTTEGGRIRILAGLPGSDGYVNGQGTAARFKVPKGVACDASGNTYVADSGNARVRKIDIGGKVTTLVGGFTDPTAVAVAPNGEIVVADTGAHKVWRIDQHGNKRLAAGSTQGNVSGTVAGVKIKGTSAKFNAPMGVACDASGNIYVADTGNYQIKRIASDGWVTLFAGTGDKGNVLGDALTAKFVRPIAISCNASGEVFVVDRVGGKNRVKRVSPNGVVSTVAFITGSEWMSSSGALGVAVAPSGKLFVVESDGTTLVESSSSSTHSASSMSSQSRSESSESSAPSSSESSQSASSATSANSSASSSSLSVSSPSSTLSLSSETSSSSMTKSSTSSTLSLSSKTSSSSMTKSSASSVSSKTQSSSSSSLSSKTPSSVSSSLSSTGGR